MNPKASKEIHQICGKPRHHTRRHDGTRGSSGPNRTSSGQPRRDKLKQMKCKFCSRIQKESCPAWGKSCDACKGKNHFKNYERCPKSKKMFMVCMNTATLTLIVARALTSVQSLLLMYAQSNRLKISLSTATW